MSHKLCVRSNIYHLSNTCFYSGINEFEHANWNTINFYSGVKIKILNCVIWKAILPFVIFPKRITVLFACSALIFVPHTHKENTFGSYYVRYMFQL